MKKLLLLITLVAGVIAFALPAQATTLEFSLDTPFQGPPAKPNPDGSGPWLNALFDDGGTTGSVDLTLTATLTDPNSVGQWYFNLDPDFDPGNLVFTPVAGYTAPLPNSILKGTDGYMADGDGNFDILFDFPPPPTDPANKVFNGSEFIKYQITSIDPITGLFDPITALSFKFQSIPDGGEGIWYTAAHIQSILTDPPGSTWIGDGGAPIPEPSTILLVGTGLLGIIGFGRKRFNKKA